MVLVLFHYWLPHCFTTGTSRCEYGWTELGGECYKLFCDIKYWSYARLECFKHEADLASFDTNLDLFTEYLERVRVRDGGLHTIAVGLQAIKDKWFWLNGKQYKTNMTSPILRAGLIWNDLSREWRIKGAGVLENGFNVEHNFAGFFCQKIRGIWITLSFLDNVTLKFDAFS